MTETSTPSPQESTAEQPHPTYDALESEQGNGVLQTDEMQSADEDEERLTARRWSVGTAVGFTALTAGVTLGGGLLAGALNSLAIVERLGANARALVIGGVLILTYVLLILAVRASARGSGHTLAGAVGMRPLPIVPTLATAFGVAIGSRFIAGLYGIMMQRLGLDLPGQNLDPTSIFPQSWVGVVLTLVLACLVAPIAEEMVFRGVLLSALHDRWGVRVAVLGSSAVFAALHVLPYAIPPIFILSVLLGRAFVRSRSLWLPIAAHSLFNFVGVLAVYALKWANVL